MDRFAWKDLIALRMERLCLPSEDRPGGTKRLEDYDTLFRDLSPVPTVAWCAPGTPPSLTSHAGFDDEAYNARRRASRAILKGRFGSRIAYVAAEDLELYACLYRKPLPRLTLAQERMLALLGREGPMNIGLIKDITGLPVKEITPILHRLQEAFLIYEDQVDSEGDRGFYVFESEFPDIDSSSYDRIEALERVLPRLVRRMVFLRDDAAAAVYGLPVKDVRAATARLGEQGVLKSVSSAGQTGWMTAEDADGWDDYRLEPVRGVLAVERNGVLMRAEDKMVKASFTGPGEVLCGLLIDGEIQGVVRGRFKFGPHLLENVCLSLPDQERSARREEILDAVYRMFDREKSPLQNYNGAPL